MFNFFLLKQFSQCYRVQFMSKVETFTVNVSYFLFAFSDVWTYSHRQLWVVGCRILPWTEQVDHNLLCTDCLSLNDLSVLMVESWWQTKEFLSEPLLLKATHSQVSFLCSVLPGAITSFLFGYKTIYVCIRKFTSYTRKIDFNVNTHTGRLESW